jgi:UDP-N-acetylglucosamine acyltransferase
MDIHATAIVDPKAELADDVIIGPYAVIGPHVRIDSGTTVGSHTVIDGWTEIGRNNRISSFVSIGFPPQDLKYKGGPTRLVIGDGNTIREYATIHRGTEHGGGVTQIGNHNLIMAYVHVAHDCILHNRVIMANAAMLAGHVVIEDDAVIGGLAAIHQFSRIGTHAYIGAKAGIKKDIPPYMLATGYPAKLYGPNTVGLKRKGFSSEAIQGLKKAYKIIFRSGLTLPEAVEETRREVGSIAEVGNLLRFIEGTQRGLTR